MFNKRFAFEFQGGDEGNWTPPWMDQEHHHHRHEHRHGPHFFAMRMKHGLFGPGGPFGHEGPFEGPFREGRRFFGRGDMKYALLGLLQEHPMHGYEMMKALEERSHGFYTPSAGSIYPTLQLLEDRGLVTVNEADGKKVYSITDAGRTFLAERQKEQEDFTNTPPWGRGLGQRWNDPEFQAVRTESMEVARLFAIAGRLAFRDPQKLTALHTIIEKSRKDLSDLIYGSSSNTQDPPTPPTADNA